VDVEEKFPEHVRNYVQNLRDRLQKSYSILEKNKITKMDRAQVDYKRKIRKFNYEVGEWVLCSHPKVKRGLSRGLAPRYYGPFCIVKKYSNGCNYMIKRVGQEKAKVRQVHQNNLKLYFKRGHPDDEGQNNSENSTQEQIKRKYNKNPNNPRWLIHNTNKETSGMESEESMNETSDDEESAKETTSESEEEKAPSKRTKRKYTKNLKNKR